MVVQHNMLAMNANRNLNVNTGKQAKRTEKLSSGYKINRAADDAAGLAISEKMRRQVRGLTQASANCQDGVSLVQIADGAMAEVHDMLDRCTELSVKAANGTLSDTDRAYIQSEIDEIKSEIDAIKEKTTFNEIPVLKGAEVEPSSTGPTVLGGLPAWVKDGSNNSVSAGQLSETFTATPSGGSSGTYLGKTLDFSALNTTNVSDLAADNSGIYTTCCTCDNHYSIKFVTGTASAAKHSGNHYIYEVSIDNVTTGSELVDRIYNAVGENPTGHYTHLAKVGDKLLIYDERPEYATSGAPSGRGLFGPGVAYDKKDIPVAPDVIIQAGAENDENQRIGIKLPSISCSALNITATNVRTESAARKAIDDFKNAKEHVSKERSRMGAYQNRLEHTIKNLDNVVENTTAAESAIRDTDMAAMMVEFSNGNILAQAGQAMLAQANQSNQGVLSLLQ